MAEFKIGRLRFVWRGVWTTGFDYVKDDVIRVGGSSYVCIQGHTSGATFADNAANFEKMQEGILFRDSWQPATVYDTNDIVVYGGIAYIVIEAHVSTSSFDPTKFDYLVKGYDWRGDWVGSTAYKLNDLVKYGANVWLVTTSHTSTSSFDETKVTLFVPGLEFEDSWSPVTTYQAGDLVTYGGYVYIGLTTNINKVPSTSSSDWDILTTGWNNRGDWSAVTAYKTGDVVVYGGNSYESIADSTGIVATNPTYWKLIVAGLTFSGTWADGVDYKVGEVLSYGSSTYRVKQDHTSANSGAFRPDLDTGGAYYDLVAEGDTNYVTTTRGDLITRTAVANARLPIGTDGQVLRSDGTDPVWAYIDRLDNIYYVAPDGVDAADRGETLDRPWATIAYACSQVNSVTTTPATIYVKSGTYEEVLPISVPVNVSLVGDELRTTIVSPQAGYETQDMFYLRDGSNLRNLSLAGLSNTLTALLPSGTKRTQNSFVSLDPGSGPGDTSVHITNKSPYVQNCSTFGTRVCGLNIDGDLHNAGNRSIVANDFTQVIDDGIGVWVNGQGRSELVSVFTYYNYIGYLCTNGGTIRGVNGNNSYGEFGSVSEEGDPTETPQTGTVNNRANEALIGSVLAGGDEIISLEIENGGEAYTTASVTVSGNGAGAVATPVIANGVISAVTVTGAGSGHLYTQNNAQTGDTTKITLAVTDSAPTNGYNGMRITIIDGTGAGQTGIIGTYNGGTKVATVYQDNGTATPSTPGWDHLVTGTAIEPVLNETTRYRIEPRIYLSGGSAPSSAASLRAVIENQELVGVYMINGGAGYSSGSAPAIVVVDPNASSLGTATVVVKNGAIRGFTFSNRGTGYTSASAVITGDGYADIAQTGGYLNVSGLSQAVSPGANILISGDTTVYRCVAFSNQTGSSPNISGRIRIAPYITNSVSPAHGAALTITELYSNVRLTGHDFLNIGTGGIASTNYPGTPSTPPVPANEVVEYGGGRVFYTSTDQDGNFRVGELFKVEQATGIATLNADAFNLSGLQELQLGSVALGGSGVSIREFSADPLLTADSDAIVPTQRAVKTFVENIIGAGGSNIAATTLTLGGMTLNNYTVSATGLNNLVFDAADPAATIIFNKIPTSSVAPTSGTHLTNKTYTDYTYAPTIENLSLDVSTGVLVYQEEHADESTTVSHSESNNLTVDQAYIGQVRSSVSVNSDGHLIITM